MLPLKVFVKFAYTEVKMFDFATQMEARAFYYGMRACVEKVRWMEEMPRASYSQDMVNQRKMTVFGTLQPLRWMLADLADTDEPITKPSHYTIYDYTRHQDMINEVERTIAAMAL
jgi:hypothetical protein